MMRHWNTSRSRALAACLTVAFGLAALPATTALAGDERGWRHGGEGSGSAGRTYETRRDGYRQARDLSDRAERSGSYGERHHDGGRRVRNTTNQVVVIPAPVVDPYGAEPAVVLHDLSAGGRIVDISPEPPSRRRIDGTLRTAGDRDVIISGLSRSPKHDGRHGKAHRRHHGQHDDNAYRPPLRLTDPIERPLPLAVGVRLGHAATRHEPRRHQASRRHGDVSVVHNHVEIRHADTVIVGGAPSGTRCRCR